MSVVVVKKFTVSSMGAASAASSFASASCVSYRCVSWVRRRRGDSSSRPPGRTHSVAAAAAVRGNHDDDVDGGFERRTRLECRTSVGVRLERRLREEGREAFARSADEALSALASQGRGGGFMNQATVGDLRVGFLDADDLSVGREALKRMEVEDIMYLSAARDVIEAGGGETSASSSTSTSANWRQQRVRLMHRCQKLQTMLPDGSDDLLINLIVRVIENVSKNSKKIGVTYAVPASTLADVYKKCATFGYFLQSSKRRLELEHFVPISMESIDMQVLAYPRKMVRYGILSANLKAMEGEDVVDTASTAPPRRVSGYKVPVQLRVPGGYQIASDLINLKDYIDEMGPQARAQAARISSVEANDVLQMHVSSLFDGDVGRALTSSGQFRRKHRTNCSTGHCIVEERVAIHLNQLKHLILEACAFGAALAKTEHSIDHKFGNFDAPLLTRQ